MALKQITNTDLANKGVYGMPDAPGLAAAEMQTKLEEIVRSVVIPAFNENASNTYDKTEVAAQIAQKIIEIGAGDMSKAIYGGSADGVVKASDKFATPRKIGDEYFDGTKDITLAQMGAASTSDVAVIKNKEGTLINAASAAQPYRLSNYYFSSAPSDMPTALSMFTAIVFAQIVKSDVVAILFVTGVRSADGIPKTITGYYSGTSIFWNE